MMTGDVAVLPQCSIGAVRVSGGPSSSSAGLERRCRRTSWRRPRLATAAGSFADTVLSRPPRRVVENLPVTTEEDIRAIARSLPGSFERESYGGCPSWRTSPRLFAWIRENPDALVVWVESLEAKDGLLATDPGKFFTTSHYNGQPIVLVRLDAVEVDEARELVIDSWRVRAPRALTRGYGDGGQRP